MSKCQNCGQNYKVDLLIKKSELIKQFELYIKVFDVDDSVGVTTMPLLMALKDKLIVREFNVVDLAEAEHIADYIRDQLHPKGECRE